MKEEHKTIYRADDGTIFEDQILCKKYEDDILAKEKATSYWIIHNCPDLCEGRGYHGICYVQVYITPSTYIDHQTWMEDWCIRTYGKKIEYIQGVAPMESWRLHRINREKYLSPKHGYLGTTEIKPQVFELSIGANDLGLVVKKD